MNRDADLIPLLRDWLADGDRDVPGPVRIAVLETIAAVPQRRHRWLASRPNPLAGQRQLRVIALVAVLIALLALLAAASLVPFAGSSPKPAHVKNGWIAFSTQPHDTQVGVSDVRRGGDIYIAHDRDDLRVLVSRGPEMDTNVCPAFSPDGTRLAYGELTDAGPALVILDLDPDGTVTGRTRLPVDATNTAAPCPRWSDDGTRIGSLERRNLVVIHGLDGSILEAVDGDPTFADFAWDIDPWDSGPLISPSGELGVMWRDGGYFTHPLDGSTDRRIGTQSGALAGWSPDSSRILLMHDGGMAMALDALSVEPPFEKTVIADGVPVNGARSWPGRRDVSWQALSE